MMRSQIDYLNGGGGGGGWGGDGCIANQEIENMSVLHNVSCCCNISMV